MFYCISTLLGNLMQNPPHTNLLSRPTFIEALFSVATATTCRGGRCLFPLITPLTLDIRHIMMSVNKEAANNIFGVFGMTRPGIEPGSLESLVNSINIWLMSRYSYTYTKLK